MQELPAIITRALIDHIRQTYHLNWNGLHGWDHWVRVWENGQRLASLNGADLDVVALFAFTHDMDRLSDGIDPLHGPRAARRIEVELQGTYFQLEPRRLKWLLQAVAEHTNGHQQADLTVQTCWDSDRLDLGRAGITPIPQRLCTPQAQDPAIIAWAFQRSIA